MVRDSVEMRNVTTIDRIDRNGGESCESEMKKNDSI